MEPATRAKTMRETLIKAVSEGILLSKRIFAIEVQIKVDNQRNEKLKYNLFPNEGEMNFA